MKGRFTEKKKEIVNKKRWEKCDCAYQRQNFQIILEQLISLNKESLDSGYVIRATNVILILENK